MDMKLKHPHEMKVIHHTWFTAAQQKAAFGCSFIHNHMGAMLIQKYLSN